MPSRDSSNFAGDRGVPMPLNARNIAFFSQITAHHPKQARTFSPPDANLRFCHHLARELLPELINTTAQLTFQLP
jgi:hypothetical protein